jgi:hypothetical protein
MSVRMLARREGEVSILFWHGDGPLPADMLGQKLGFG